jgi:hypothetical protein
MFRKADPDHMLSRGTTYVRIFGAAEKRNTKTIVEPHTYADPELKSSRRYTNLSAAEMRQALIDTGRSEREVPRCPVNAPCETSSIG